MHQPLVYTLIILSALTACCLASDAATEWSYDRDDTNYGPSKWATNFHICDGIKNSPIDIVKKDAVAKEAEAWTLTNWEKDLKFTVSDDQRTLRYSIDDDFEVTSTGGKLGNTYKLVQFHLHWGSKNVHGSEHTVAGKAYPMEAHFVQINEKFPNNSAAAESGEDDAFGVLGFFFELQDEDNADLEKFMTAVTTVRANPNVTEAEGYTLGPLTAFTSKCVKGNFFRYYGGFTTPGCNEQVKWTVFETPIGISAAQMATIRDQPAETTAKFGSEFYRDVMPLGERSVIYYDVAYETSSAHQTLPLLILLAFSFIATNL